jgi:hypothetical protein
MDTTNTKPNTMPKMPLTKLEQTKKEAKTMTQQKITKPIDRLFKNRLAIEILGAVLSG